MAKRMLATTLPKEVLAELRQRFVHSNFSGYESHAAWLQAKGFPISKSAIHRYATEYAVSVMSEQYENVALSPVEARLRCLEVAASMNQTSAPAELIRHAEHFLKLVYAR